jgi:hypothetical protein
MDGFLEGMSLADFQQFAKMIGDVVGNQVIGQINGVFIKIFGTVFTVLIGAISFLYLSQRSDAKEAQKGMIEAYQKLLAVIEESTKTMEIVKSQLTASKDREKEALESLADINATLKSLKETEKTILESLKIKKNEQNN